MALTLIDKIYAAGTDIIGTVDVPAQFAPYGSITTPGKGLTLLISNILRLVFVVAGIFAFFNLIVAGFQYMGAGGDSKALNAAWGRIWQSLLGLVIVVGSFAMASLLGYLIFGDAGFILSPKVYGPK